VFSIFNGPQGNDPNGVNIADVVAALNGRFTDAQVREAVESLVNDGHLYSTIDDAHFRSTLL
jgi:replication factor A2